MGPPPPFIKAEEVYSPSLAEKASIEKYSYIRKPLSGRMGTETLSKLLHSETAASSSSGGGGGGGGGGGRE